MTPAVYERREPPPPQPGLAQPAIAGTVTAIVGFTSSFAIVLSGLRAVGADSAEAASGLLVLCVAMGLVGCWLGWRYRMPLAVAWSTPGAALLVAAGHVEGGYPAAIGAFLLAAVLTVLAGLIRPLSRAIASIPAPLASALLAGVLISVCVAPVEAAVELPWLTLPVIAVWALLTKFARRWAVPGSLVAAAVAIVASGELRPGATDDVLPTLAFTTPSFAEPATLLGLGIPLFIVTMASQNLAGISVLRLHGYDPDLRPSLLTTGAASVVIAPFGGHGINLAAITAALVAGPDAHPDPSRRWIAAFVGSALYFAIGLTATLVTALIAASPPLVIEAVAGLALLGALAGALTAAMADERMREAAVVTLVASASGVTAFGISGPFWGLLAGLTLLALQRARTGRTTSAPARPSSSPSPAVPSAATGRTG